MSPKEKRFKQERMALSVWEKDLNKEKVSWCNNRKGGDNNMIILRSAKTLNTKDTQLHGYFR